MFVPVSFSINDLKLPSTLAFFFAHLCQSIQWRQPEGSRQEWNETPPVTGGQDKHGEEEDAEEHTEAGSPNGKAKQWMNRKIHDWRRAHDTLATESFPLFRPSKSRAGRRTPQSDQTLCKGWPGIWNGWLEFGCAQMKSTTVGRTMV